MDILKFNHGAIPFLLLLFPLILAPKSYGQAFPQAEPDMVGFSAERLDRIADAVQPFVNKNQIAGALTLVARKGKLVHFETYGQRNIEAGLPMDKNTLFRIYSMSKPITSVAVLMLYEEGKFFLDDPVAKYIPQFEKLKVYDTEKRMEVPLDRPMTIRDLLTHTSGLTYGLFTQTPVDTMYMQAGLFNQQSEDNGGNTLEGFVLKLSELPLLHQPGTTWHYSVSTDVLGYLVERVSGQTFAQFLKTRIFNPLGMNNTTFEVARDDLDRFAVNYSPGQNGQLMPIDGGESSTFAAPVTFYSGGGGLVSTADDYLKFAQMLLNEGELNGTRILGRKTVELMTANHLDGEQGPGKGFGLGVDVTIDLDATQILGSEGAYSWSGAANTYFFIDPDEELIAMVWTQLFPYGLYPIADAFKVAVYQALVD